LTDGEQGINGKDTESETSRAEAVVCNDIMGDGDGEQVDGKFDFRNWYIGT
jgi:hypothetical protein